MKILMAASEAAPFAKTGGLADVAGALPRALRRLGHDVRLLLPWYRGMEARAGKTRRGPERTTVAIAGRLEEAVLRKGELGGMPVYFLEHPTWFDRAGLYGEPGGDYPDNAERFGFFCRALLQMLPQVGFRPDVVHVHDWQSALVPVLLRTEFARHPFFAGTGSLLTIHNLGYQGLFPPATLGRLGLDPALYSIEGLEYHGALSLLKGGILFADRVNTVSPTYCLEILEPRAGHGFDGILRSRLAALSGILNGLDPDDWNPARDGALQRPFSARNPAGKAACKAALQQELGLPQDPDRPLVAMVTRLDAQKGIDLVEGAWKGLLRRGLQFVLLGTGGREQMELFDRLRSRAPKEVSINLFFDEALSRRIYAGSDLLLMPSRYEPCGLAQLIALRYGTLPVVRRTGGLADTVRDADDDPGRGNGFLFEAASPEALLGGLDRALAAWREPERRRRLIRRGMTLDFSWDRSAAEYLKLYGKIKEARRG